MCVFIFWGHIRRTSEPGATSLILPNNMERLVNLRRPDSRPLSLQKSGDMVDTNLFCRWYSSSRAETTRGDSICAQNKQGPIQVGVFPCFGGVSGAQLFFRRRASRASGGWACKSDALHQSGVWFVDLGPNTWHYPDRAVRSCLWANLG